MHKHYSATLARQARLFENILKDFMKIILAKLKLTNFCMFKLLIFVSGNFIG
jgi:hypothetical protein